MYALGMYLSYFYYSILMVPSQDKNLYDKSKSISLDISYGNEFLRNQE